MLPFCGYNMGDYLAPLAEGRRADKDQAKLPRIYFVNWFRKDEEGPVRVAGLRREQPGPEVDRRAPGRQGRRGRDADRPPAGQGTPWTPRASKLSDAELDFLLTVDKEVWREEAALIPDHLNTFGDHTPKELWDEYHALVKRLA